MRGDKKHDKKQAGSVDLAEQLSKMRELMEDFWELRGSTFQELSCLS